MLAGLTLCGMAHGEERPLPCHPAKPTELMLVEIEAMPGSDLADPRRGSFGVRVDNRSGRMVCRLAARVIAGGRARAASCVPVPAGAVGPEGQMLCTLGAAEDPAPRATGRRGRRRAAGRSASAKRARLAVTALELVAREEHTAWLARRAAHTQPASAPAARAGFSHTLAITRAGDPRAARLDLDHVVNRLRECLFVRARRNPKLTVQATLRLGVSRGRADDGPPEALLAVKVLGPATLAPEMRDCVRVLDLVTLGPGANFEATGVVRYDGDGRPPPEAADSKPTYIQGAPGGRPRGRTGHGRSGMSRRGM